MLRHVAILALSLLSATQAYAQSNTFPGRFGFVLHGREYPDQRSACSALLATLDPPERYDPTTPPFDPQNGNVPCFGKLRDGTSSFQMYSNDVSYTTICPHNSRAPNAAPNPPTPVCECESGFQVQGQSCVDQQSVGQGGTPLGAGQIAGARPPAQVSPLSKEPGEWRQDFAAGSNMTTEQAKYQKQVTKPPPGEKHPVGVPTKTYYVGGRSFDGYEPGARGAPGTLVEAKHLGDEGRFARAYTNMLAGNYSDARQLFERAENLLEQALAQAEVTKGMNVRIEWRVSGQQATKALKQLFENESKLRGRILVVHMPLTQVVDLNGAPTVQ